MKMDDHTKPTHMKEIKTLGKLFSPNRNIRKSSCGLCFWASDHLIDWFYYDISIKGPEAQKQRPHELLWMLWFDEKVYLQDIW